MQIESSHMHLKQFHNYDERKEFKTVKRKCLNKIFSMVLVGTMVMGMAACGNTANVESAAGSKTETSVQESTETTPVTETKAVEGEITYPLEDTAKLTLWTNYPKVASVYSSYKESPYHMGLQENTGVEVEWNFPAKGASSKEAYNLLLTEEKLPHIITYSVSISDTQLLAQDGMIWDLTDYIPEYAPDYWEFLNSDPTLLAASKADDNRIYGVKGYLENDYNKTFVGPVIRQDWLDECDLEAPVTLEDWENILVTFNEKYGAKLGWAKNRYTAGIASGTGAHASLTAEFYVDENNQVKLGNMDENWKEMLEVLHKWYEMGLIDQDSFTMDDKAVRTKIANNEIGVSFTAMSQFTNWIADAEANGADWVGIEYPRVAKGEPTVYIQSQETTSDIVSMITKTCSEEEMITALKWLNYGFTEEGYMYTNYGTENETYTLDANGMPQWTEKMTKDPDGMSVAILKYAGTSGMPMGSIQAAHMVQIKNDEKAAAAVYKWIENTTVGKFQYPSRAVSRTDEEAVVYSDVYTPISSYISEMALKFILGEESLDNFDAYVAKLKEMGIEDVLKVQQAAYDRYLAR